jgi:hypothetical protein
VCAFDSISLTVISFWRYFHCGRLCVCLCINYIWCDNDHTLGYSDLQSHAELRDGTKISMLGLGVWNLVGEVLGLYRIL